MGVNHDEDLTAEKPWVALSFHFVVFNILQDSSFPYKNMGLGVFRVKEELSRGMWTVPPLQQAETELQLVRPVSRYHPGDRSTWVFQALVAECELRLLVLSKGIQGQSWKPIKTQVLMQAYMPMGLCVFTARN